MKKTLRLLSLFLAFVLLVQMSATSVFAFEITGMTRDEWNAYYSSLSGENTLPTLCVGADETQLNLTWHADADKAQARVRLSDNAAMADCVEFTGEIVDAENDTQKVCRVIITGIEADTTYYYQWFTGDAWSDSYEYTSKSFDSYKMLVVGDIQIGGQTADNSEEQSRVGYVWQGVLEKALSENPDISFLLSPGDNTSTGKTGDEWQTLLMPRAMRNLPVALAIGNHDKKGFSYNYYTYMPNEYYGKYFEGLDRDFWFRYGDVLYLVFDATSGSAIDHEAMAKQAVEMNPDVKWKIAVMHQAPYAPGNAALEPETGVLLNGVFQPIFNMCDVDLVLTGHTHCQGRSHFISEGAVVGLAKSGKTYTDPNGIIYLNSNAMCDQWGVEDNSPLTAYAFEEGDVPTYTTIEFTDDLMAVRTYRGDNSELLDSISIRKTDGFVDPVLIGDNTDYVLYNLVKLLGLIYLKIDAIVVAIRGGHF